LAGVCAGLRQTLADTGPLLDNREQWQARIDGALHLMQHELELTPVTLIWRFRTSYPQGKTTRALDEAFGDKGHKEFSIQPCLGALLILLGEMSQLGQLLEALEDQLDLPAQAVDLQDLLRVKDGGAVVKTITYSA